MLNTSEDEINDIVSFKEKLIEDMKNEMKGKSPSKNKLGDGLM
jgi:hypothetical protein